MSQKNEVVKIHVLPGGKPPERKTEGAVGFDLSIRAIVHSEKKDLNNLRLRQTIFDFKNTPENPEARRHVHKTENGFVYRMDPHESLLAGIGFVTDMPFPMVLWIAPRSGLATKWGITVTNAPGTIDPDYRGEAGVLVYNRNNYPFDLQHGMRIAQGLFQWALIPDLEEINLCDMSKSLRGAGGFGSTGLT